MFQPIRRIIPTSLQGMGIETPISAMRILEAASSALVRMWGAERASFVAPVSFSGGTILVEVRSPSAAHALAQASVPWMNEINRTLGIKKVERFRIRRVGF